MSNPVPFSDYELFIILKGWEMACKTTTNGWSIGQLSIKKSADKTEVTVINDEGVSMAVFSYLAAMEYYALALMFYIKLNNRNRYTLIWKARAMRDRNETELRLYWTEEKDITAEEQGRIISDIQDKAENMMEHLEKAFPGFTKGE